MIKPSKLNPGDKVATISPSGGGPSVFPQRYQAGVRHLETEFGLEVVEMLHTLKDANWLAHNPKARADDLMQAFSDPSIKGIITTIGGDDSIRLLPYLDQSHAVLQGWVGFILWANDHGRVCRKRRLVSLHDKISS